MRFDFDHSEGSVDEGDGAAWRLPTVVSVVFLFGIVADPISGLEAVRAGAVRAVVPLGEFRPAAV